MLCSEALRRASPGAHKKNGTVPLNVHRLVPPLPWSSVQRLWPAELCVGVNGKRQL
uniref:Uncharacterized protein n=1 Tax=Anguilla anguilla TaxID=7936 RepID=A0A0E9QD34_ANGAN